MRSVENARIAALDGLRALAVLAVVIGHHDASPSWSLYPVFAAVQVMFSASMAVMLFFALSAFMLTSLAVREYDRTGALDVRAFYVRRALRIWPLYAIAVAFGVFAARPGTLVTAPGMHEWLVEHLWLFATFTLNWSLALRDVGGHVDNSGSLGILWTVSVEEQFYLAFAPFMAAILVATTRRRSLLLGGALAVATALTFGAYFVLTPLQSDAYGSMPPALYFATFSYVPIFVAGGTAGWLYARRHAGARREIRSPLAAPALAGGFVAVTVLWQDVLDDGRTLAYPLAFPLIAVVLGTLVFWVAEHPEAPVCRVLRWRPLAAVGVVSYGVYVWHMVAGQTVARFLVLVLTEAQLDTDWASTAALVLHIGLSIGFAGLSYALVERPFLRLRERLTGQRARPRRAIRHGWTSSKAWPRPSEDAAS